MSSREEAKARARAEREAAERAVSAREARTRRLRLLGGILAAAVVIVVAIVVISSSGGKKGHAPTSGAVRGARPVATELAGIPQRGTVLGRPQAPVTLVEYGDLKCPACQQFALSTFPGVVNDYVRTGRLRVEYRPQTFIGQATAPGDSERAARFALAAGRQGKFWNFAELFYVNQQDESSAYVDDAFLRRLGGAVPGLDVARALAARQAPSISATLKGASAGFDAAGFDSTPSFLIGRSGGTLKPYKLTSLDPKAFGPVIRQLGG